MRKLLKRIEGRDYKDAPIVYMMPDNWQLLLMRISEWVVDYRMRKSNPYKWNNENYWRFVKDVAEKTAKEMQRTVKN